MRSTTFNITSLIVIPGAFFALFVRVWLDNFGRIWIFVCVCLFVFFVEMTIVDVRNFSHTGSIPHDLAITVKFFGYSLILSIRFDFAFLSQKL